MLAVNKNDKHRCFGNKPNQKFYADYHDHEWGIPVYDDHTLFEMLILEGAQAGLSWETVLKKRQGYRNAFYHFDVVKVASMNDSELEALRTNDAIIKNRLKIYAARTNAQVFIRIQKEYNSFAKYLWSFVHNKPIKNHWKNFQQVPTTTPISDAISTDLKKRGMKFVGSTIIYAYMQAVGLVDDHLQDCWKYNQLR
ncbi:MAG: DNA-3-methyladenine glycosylase I [Epsilonproteobacteria bacterium]|nr:DNA-3-methyladenine glycosylase I [Campylobacterota bacterium]|tara:strand:- start:7405 stop:7992 length:588 start_codon:yes stop_codon:yes gene_type:complete